MPNKAEREGFLARGLCGNCGGRPTLKGSRLCLICYESHIRRDRAYYAKNRERLLRLRNEENSRRRAEGRCSTCGHALDPEIDEGFKSCCNCRMQLHQPMHLKSGVVKCN